MNASCERYPTRRHRLVIKMSRKFKKLERTARVFRDGLRARSLLAVLFLPAAAAAQGFAGLGGQAVDFTPVTAPAEIVFPRDHGPHPGFRVEWWYLTANLRGADGADYGAQWTLFRSALAPGPEPDGWDSTAVWMGHAAATGAGVHHFAETFSRGGIGQAGVTLDPFRGWIDDWEIDAAPNPGGDALGALRVRARGTDFAYDLRATAPLPPGLQGDGGFSVKSEQGQASYYYSQPFYRVEGTLALDGRETAVTGEAWLDREWSSQPLTADQLGWDWFALHLEGGAKAMLYGMRSRTAPPYVVGTWIEPDGAATPLRPGEITLTPRAETEVAGGRRVPTGWHVEIPSRGLAVDTAPLNAQSWMGTLFPYWEGPIRIEGSHAGRGYLEMTGYQ